MIGLLLAITLFNTVAFTTNKRLTWNQIVHIWMFTIAFQGLVDLYVAGKYDGYWYFSQAIDWESILALTILIPPVNMMFLNGYPFGSSLCKRMLYIGCWTIGILMYEAIALLPEPWGYFHHVWWRLRYSLFVYPLLLIMVVCYYKWIRKIEK
ncbi:hypothetical protein [Priestia filamentosa]|uniref:hypothetical protein n=1 Tax=Priestia filamentosa TaxID=1402861 RepID=UPI0004749D2E